MLKEALETIQKECFSHKNCFDCPLRSEDILYNCGLRAVEPDCWEISDNKEKLFK